MRTILTLPAIAISAFVFSHPCDHVKGAGEVVKKTLIVDAFHGIDVEGSIDVVLTQSATRSVEVEAQENIAALITTQVKNGIWTIGTGDKSYSTNKPFIVYISVPMIDIVSIEGSGDVKSSGAFSADDVLLDIQGSGDLTAAFNARSIKADIQGSGDMKLSGTCSTLKVHVEGSGDVNAKHLGSVAADVSTAGSGDVSVNVSESLNASIAGSGDVVYSGKPSRIDKNVDGSGEVRPATAPTGPL